MGEALDNMRNILGFGKTKISLLHNVHGRDYGDQRVTGKTFFCDSEMLISVDKLTNIHPKYEPKSSEKSTGCAALGAPAKTPILVGRVA